MNIKRRAFFSLHYPRDLWRANVVRNSGVVIASAAAGFQDASLWEEEKKKGDATIKAMIDKALENTEVTVVLIGAKTAGRMYINYEIEQSIKRGNGILGIHVHNIKGPSGNTDEKGIVPAILVKGGYRVYNWPFDNNKFAKWIEEACEASVKNKNSFKWIL